MHPELESLLLLMGGARRYRDETPGRNRISGYDHMLQTATRAERDGAPAYEVVAALVHDAARPYNDARHGEIIAHIMRDRLPLSVLAALRYHGEFQATPLTKLGARYGRRSWFPLALRLAMWDAASFDPSYGHEPIEHFVPTLEEYYAPA